MFVLSFFHATFEFQTDCYLLVMYTVLMYIRINGQRNMLYTFFNVFSATS